MLIDVSKIKEILRGIDKEELEDSCGWWDTSDGAEFGERKLNELLDYIAKCTEVEQKTTM